MGAASSVSSVVRPKELSVAIQRMPVRIFEINTDTPCAPLAITARIFVPSGPGGDQAIRHMPLPVWRKPCGSPL